MHSVRAYKMIFAVLSILCNKRDGNHIFARCLQRHCG